MKNTSDHGEPTQRDQSEVPEGVLGAYVLPAFSPFLEKTPLGAMRAPATTSAKMQVVAGQSMTWELTVATVLDAPRQGATTEIVALVASAGEQFGNAVTAIREARRWMSVPPSDGREAMGARAMAEDATYRVLSVGHALVNATLRLIHLYPDLSVMPVGDLRGAVQALETGGRKAWLSMNMKTTEQLLADAQRHSVPDLIDMAQRLRDLASMSRWEAVVELRHNDYHRLRAQSLPGGISADSPWSPEPGDVEGRATGFDLFQTYSPPEAGPIVDDAEWAVVQMGLLIDAWLVSWDRARDASHALATDATAEKVRLHGEKLAREAAEADDGSGAG